ncbi:MAG: GlmU protein [Candidatus Cloacimonetes bacterium HGW-Cloacimonetes-3]|jgi:UDP-N-acetylglucosamine diphosphorylase/glucosamine-1-phosphate N-acetyltransferase|nr:MAG: GlmU protein [Candidatus Cloacimonetes bacterium HGW-Cloacimonetes-3]
MNALAAIILAAGKGTRMKSDRAKVTFPIADKPMVQRVVDTALAMQCERICIVVGYLKETVISCLEEDDHLEFVEQKEQLGTGHAVSITEALFKNPEQDILILCGDVPLLTPQTVNKIYQEHLATNAACTVLTAFLDDPGKYGRMLRDADGKLCGIIEYKDASPDQRQIKEWNTGIYCFNAKELFDTLRKTSNDNQQGEYYLTDAVEILYKAGRTIASVVLEDLMEVSGVNSQEQLAELEDIYVDKIRKKWLNSGVVMHNPNTIYIGDDVIIETDVEISQNTVIKGKCNLEKGCVIGPNCYLEHSTVCNDTILQGHNILVNAIIHEHEILEFGAHVVEETPYE